MRGFDTNNTCYLSASIKTVQHLGPYLSIILKIPIAANWKGVCLQNKVNSIHTMLKYGIYYDFGIGNGAVLKSSSQ